MRERTFKMMKFREKKENETSLANKLDNRVRLQEKTFKKRESGEKESEKTMHYE